MNSPRHPLSALLLCGLLLLTLNAPAQAGSATWNLNPGSGNWNTAANWTPATVPNGPADTATFGVSNITDVSLSAAIEVEGIVFGAGASPYTISAAQALTISGTGIVNNSGAEENFASNDSSPQITFTHSATAGSGTVFTNDNGRIEFDGSASAGSATFVTSNGGITIFFDQATTENATFITNSGGTTFPGNGANATFISNPGAGGGAAGGATYFGSGDRAGNATLIANAGPNGHRGGIIIFDNGSTGGTGKVQVFGNGLLELSQSTETVLGSIEGDGIISLNFVLKVGNNNLSTVFGGQIKDADPDEFGGRVIKEGGGTLTLSFKNTYSGGTVVLDGTLNVASGSNSGTGTGPVNVNSGTLGGNGTIAGAVTIGTGNTAGAFLAPGLSARKQTLTIQDSLSFKAQSSYLYKLNTTKGKAAMVVANGVHINSGAEFLVNALGDRKLPAGKVFTAISNSAATPISGIFANLADGSTFTAGNNNFQASYTGGDGYDLTLTVVQ